MLSETGAAPIEAITMIHLIFYLKRIKQMESVRWPKIVFNDVFCKRKKTWLQQNIKWMGRWNIHFNMCSTNNKETKAFVLDKLYKWNWGKTIGRKKKYYISEFNPMGGKLQKPYIKANNAWKDKLLIA